MVGALERVLSIVRRQDDSPADGADGARPVLTTHNLTKAFGGLIALKDVNLSIPPGVIYGLIGPNGSGKTTMINVLSGHYSATSGSVIWQGRRIERTAAHQRAMRGLIRTFQAASVFPELSVLDNVLAGCHRLGKTSLLDSTIFQWRDRSEREALREKARKAIARAGLTEQMDLEARHLTFGQQKTVDLARALAADPKLLLLDEPAAGLNAKEATDLVETLQSLRDEGRTVLLVEHNMKLVMGVCEEITVLNFGQVIAHGTPEEVRRSPVVVEAYLGGTGPTDRERPNDA